MLNEVLRLISIDIDKFNDGLKKSLKTDVGEIDFVLEHFFSTEGKKIRPILGILIARIFGEFNEKQNLFLQGIELVHNATLFHDDVIDEAKTRRNKPTLRERFSNKTAILTGDYFLSCALRNIARINNSKINQIFSNAIREICEGELQQNFDINKIVSLEKYLEKTEKKTALLFALTLEGCAILAEYSKENEIFSASEIGRNFGIFFQINDDLKNFQLSSDKPFYNDMESGVYTAPLIFLAQENPLVEKLLIAKKYDEIITLLKKSDALNLTQKLAGKYLEKAFLSLENFPNNEFLIAFKKLLSDFRYNG